MNRLPPRGPFFLFRSPYRDLEPTAYPHRLPASAGVSGSALVWTMKAEPDDTHLQAARTRQAGVALLVVLPPAEQVLRKDEIFRLMEVCRPAAVLPFHEEPSPDDLRALLSAAPDDLPGAIVDFLRWRGIPMEMEMRRLVRKTLELSVELRSVNGLARGVYLSRRALGRRFTSHGLPVPSHWLHAARVFRAALQIQSQHTTLTRIAYDLGYPDAFALSNQMKRLTGLRPSEARARRGWEWIVEAWLRKEAREGGFSEPIARIILSHEGSVDAGLLPPVPPSVARPASPVRGSRIAGQA